MNFFTSIRFILLCAIGISYSIETYAQTPLSLNQAFELAEKNNLSLQIDLKNQDLSKQDVKQSRQLFLPQVSITHTAIGTTNPLMAFGSKLNQEILTQADFNPSLLNDPDYIRDYSTKIVVNQPILNMDGVYQRKAAKLFVDLQEKKHTFRKKHTLLEVQKAYMQLQVSIKQVKVLEHAEQTALANLKYATDYLEQGYLQKSDFLDVDVRVQDVKNQLNTAKNNVLNASNYLSHLLNLESTDLIVPTDDLLPEIFEYDSLYTLPENREDIEAMHIGQEAQQQMLKSHKMKFLPRLNAFGNLELHDDQIFGTNAQGHLIGAQLSWDIFKGGEQWSNIQKGKIELEKTALDIEQYKQQSQLEINKTLRALSDAHNRLNLSKKSVLQSEEALKIRSNRFKQGLEKTTDLLMAESKYAQKQLEHLHTIFTYNYTLAYLKVLIHQQ